MDLKAASDQDGTIERVARACMVICFLATGSILIGALAIDKLHDASAPNLQTMGASSLR